jgi:O-antigen/teichoic acid export membrane protein
MAISRAGLSYKIRSRWFSDKGLTKKAYLNTLAAMLDKIALLIVGFIIHPLLVRGLGDYGYGAWQVLQRLIGYASPAGGRSNQALKWTIANRQSSTDYQEKRRQVGSAIVVWLLFLPLLVLLGSILAWFAPLWLNASPELILPIRLTAAILVVNLIVLNLVDLPRAVLVGENLGYKRMGLSALLIFIGGGFTALALYFDTGLVGVATASLAATLLTGALFLLVARLYIPWFGLARPSFSSARKFLGLSGWFLSWSFLVILMKSSDVVLLGLVDSVELVTVYSLTRYVTETIIYFITVVVFGIAPGLGRFVGSGDFSKALRVRNEIMLFTWLLATVAGITILLWNHSFVQLWVGAKYYAGLTPNLLIILMITQFVLIQNDSTIINLTLDLRRKVLLGLLSVVLSIGFAAILVGVYQQGIIGLCLGIIAGRFCLSIGYPWLIGSFFGVSLRTQFSNILRPVCISALLIFLALTLSPHLEVTTWLRLILAVMLTSLIVLLLAFFLGFSAIQRERVVHRIRKVLRPAAAAE